MINPRSTHRAAVDVARCGLGLPPGDSTLMSLRGRAGERDDRGFYRVALIPK